MDAMASRVERADRRFTFTPVARPGTANCDTWNESCRVEVGFVVGEAAHRQGVDAVVDDLSESAGGVHRGARSPSSVDLKVDFAYPSSG